MKLTKIFNLNDPGWGRGRSDKPTQQGDDFRPNKEDTPPDLDQIFDDLSKRIKSVFGGNNGSPPNNGGSQSRKPSGMPSPRNFKIGALTLGVIVAGGWLASGFYIVEQGQLGVVTQFGKYNRTVAPGFQWHIPFPVEKAELVDISRVRSFSVGYRDNARNKVLPEALMLTEDENIVDVQFDVQYRIKSGMGDVQGESAVANYLFRTVSPDESVRQAAETAMREIVGKQSMNKILYESRTQAASDVGKLMQNILDRYQTGIEVITVAIQNVQPPEQVQAAFEDAIKAGQDNERQKNEGHAYASKVIPEARGQASRLLQDAEGYKASVIGQAKGEAERFISVEKEYAQAPSITKERMYISTMEKVYQQASKVIVDTKSSQNMMYLPIDKIIEQNTPVSYSPYSSTVRTGETSSVVESSNTTSRPQELSRDRSTFSRTRSAQ